MADIFSLKDSISKMSDEAIDALIQERRANRRTVQAQSKTRKSSSKSKKKKSKNPKKDIMAHLASMSEEEKRKLKEMLS